MVPSWPAEAILILNTTPMRSIPMLRHVTSVGRFTSPDVWVLFHNWVMWIKALLGIGISMSSCIGGMGWWRIVLLRRRLVVALRLLLLLLLLVALWMYSWVL
jgi:hypothetical protein